LTASAVPFWISISELFEKQNVEFSNNTLLSTQLRANRSKTINPYRGTHGRP
jgi:hypothetical protein